MPQSKRKLIPTSCRELKNQTRQIMQKFTINQSFAKAAAKKKKKMREAWGSGNGITVHRVQKGKERFRYSN